MTFRRQQVAYFDRYEYTIPCSLIGFQGKNLQKARDLLKLIDSN